MPSSDDREDTLLSRLEQDRDRLMAEIESQVLPVVEQMTYGSQAEAASDVFEQQRTLTLRRHLERQLRAVEEAIADVRRGVHGYCAECGMPIPPERMEIVPETRWCIECQRRRERRR
jgi:RNA polymerase-binding protein DksA